MRDIYQYMGKVVKGGERGIINTGEILEATIRKVFFLEKVTERNHTLLRL